MKRYLCIIGNFSYHTKHDSKLIGDSCVLDQNRKGPADEESVISDTNHRSRLSLSTLDF